MTRFHIVIPIFNDWEVVALLLPRIDKVLADNRIVAAVVLVDDGSTVRPETFVCPPCTAISAVFVLELRRNMGHQRAIAVGLTYVQQHLDPNAVLVMDGDGEDNPEDIPKLLAKLEAEGGKKIVFAERKRRSEPLLFKFFYRVYRVLHRILTGYHVRVGNFSIIPSRALSRLVVISEMWNHYAAAVYNARIDHTTVPTARAVRLGGHSHMNFISLVVHGLSALSVYSHIIGVRLLVLAGTLLAATGAIVVAVVALQFFGSPLPPWVLYLTGIVLLVLFQALTTAVGFVFIMLSGRHGASVIPIRDYGHFVQKFGKVYP